MRILILIFISLFVSYKVAGIGGVVLALIALTVLLSIVSTFRNRSISETNENEWEAPIDTSVTTEENKVLFARDTGPAFQSWAGGPF